MASEGDGIFDIDHLLDLPTNSAEGRLDAETGRSVARVTRSMTGINLSQERNARVTRAIALSEGYASVSGFCACLDGK